MGSYGDSAYFGQLRMQKQFFDVLLEIVWPHLEKKPTSQLPISPAERLALTLKILASGADIKTVALLFRVGYETARQDYIKTCEVLWEQELPIPNEEKWREIAKGFYDEWDFPMCIGAVDGKHVDIKAPRNSGSQYFNYKKRHSIVLLAAVDAYLRFIYVDIGAYGRQGDAGIFAHSSLGRALKVGSDQLSLPPANHLPGTEQRFPCVFIADSAFPIGQHMMKPYSGEWLTLEQRIFNYQLSQARRCVESAFGLLAVALLFRECGEYFDVQ